MNKQNTWWSLILYVESESYNVSINETVSSLCKICDDYYYIIHNMDTEEDGTPKKEHIHFVAKLQYPRDRDFIKNHCGIGANYSDELIMPIPKTKVSGAIIYLIHLNAKNKYQYQDFLVETNNPYYFNKCCEEFMNGKDFSLSAIYEFIWNSNERLNMQDVAKYCINNSWITIYFKYRYQFNQELNDHNKKIVKERKHYEV